MSQIRKCLGKKKKKEKEYSDKSVRQISGIMPQEEVCRPWVVNHNSNIGVDPGPKQREKKKQRTRPSPDKNLSKAVQQFLDERHWHSNKLLKILRKQ